MRLTPQSGIQFTRSISARACFAEGSRCVRGSAVRDEGDCVRGYVINLDEPLVHRAEDDGRLAAPAMRVAVVIILLVQQRLADAQFVQHGFVGVALAVLFQDGFAEHLGGHLLFDAADRSCARTRRRH